MGVGRITGAREVTQGAVHAAHDGAGEAAHRIAAIGAHAGRDAQRIGAHGQSEAMKNGAATLNTMRDFAVKTLWEKPIAEAEEKLRELDLEARSKEWTDEHGVKHAGFDLVRGAEAANIGDQWDAYMSRKAKELFDRMGLTAGQREELASRTAKFRTETRARLTEKGAVEAITSNLADIDARAVQSGERSVMDAVERANEAAGYAEKSVGVTGNAEAGVFLKTQLDDAAAVSLSDALVGKREKLIRDKVIGGLGRKSEAVATAEADKIVRAEALSTVTALARAGHYDRARKLVEQGGKLGFDDAALAKGRELVDGMEVDAAVNEANVAISAIRDAEGNYPAGRVETIERSIATLQRVGAAQKKDSKLAASTAAAVSQLDRHADTIRFGEMIDNPDKAQLIRPDLATAKNPFKKGSRDARCWEMARKAMTKRTASGSERKSFIDAMKTNGRKYATTSPAKFYEDLNDAVAAGIITKGDKDGLVDDFESKFAKGFPGAGDEAPVLQQRFAAIASIFKDEFGNDIEAEVARDKDGFVRFDRTGAFAYDKKATPTELTIKEEYVVPARMAGTGMPGEAVYAPEMRSTVTHTLTPEEKLELSNAALRLARFDGMELGFDPVTGIEMEDGKTHKVNLVADLKRMCRILKSRKESEQARDKVFANLRGKRAMEGIVGRVTNPFGMATTSFGGMVDEYASGMEADRTEAERRAPDGDPKTAIDTFIKRIGEHGKKLRD